MIFPLMQVFLQYQCPQIREERPVVIREKTGLVNRPRSNQIPFVLIPAEVRTVPAACSPRNAGPCREVVLLPLPGLPAPGHGRKNISMQADCRVSQIISTNLLCRKRGAAAASGASRGGCQRTTRGTGLPGPFRLSARAR